MLRPGEFTASLDGDEYVEKVGGGNEVRYRLSKGGEIVIQPPPTVEHITIDFKLLDLKGEFDEEASQEAPGEEAGQEEAGT